jgi:ferrochelatase
MEDAPTKSGFSGDGNFTHGQVPAVGVLLANIGTPEAPTPKALRRYLAEFLADPRVVEMPRALWWLILHLFVLPLRPHRSARLYAKIWAPEGSPLLVTSCRQTELLATMLREEIGTPLHVSLGMRYGKPSIQQALAELHSLGCSRVLLLPLYPQYASATTGSTFDAVAAVLTRARWVPELRFVASYRDEPAYIDALAASIRDAWRSGKPERLLLSFHGIPKKASEAGDPYSCQCRKTARLLIERLGWPSERAAVTFQSRFGRAEWLTPTTDATLREWGTAGVGSVDVVCPGFAADCLETLEEIAMGSRRVFLDAGGTTFRYVPALNDRPDHIAALAAVCRRHLAGWTVSRAEWDEEAARREAAASAERARQAGAPE